MIFRQIKFTMHQTVSIDAQSGRRIIKKKKKNDNALTASIDLWIVSKEFGGVRCNLSNTSLYLQELQLFVPRNI